MEFRNCSLPAPGYYVSMMHNFHIISFPIYIVTLNALFRESSALFQTYKYYLIAHIFVNIISETYVSFFMLPMTYLPLPLLRNTGWLSDLGFSGMFQFYMLAQFVMITVGSILEMFYYRFKITVVHQMKHTFRDLLKWQVYTFRFLIFFHPIAAAATINRSIEVEGKETMRLWNNNQHLAPEITCYSVIIAILEDYVLWIMLPIYSIQVVIQLVASGGTLYYITKFIKKGFIISKSTINLQRKMIISLFIQGTIHGSLIMMPTIFMIYALFANSQLNDFAQCLLLCVAYHGLVSTVSMIIFTKPLRDRILPFMKPPQPIEPKNLSRLVSSTSYERSSNVVPPT